MALTSDMFKLFSVRPSVTIKNRQNWNLFYRDQKVYFGSNVSPNIAKVGDSLITYLVERNQLIIKTINDGRGNGSIAMPKREFFDKYSITKKITLADTKFNFFTWLQTNAHKKEYTIDNAIVELKEKLGFSSPQEYVNSSIAKI